MFLPINSEDCCAVIFFQYPLLDHSFFTGILEVWPNSTLIAFVGFGRWKPNKPHPAMDSYVDRLQNQSYIYFKYLLTSKDTFPLPPASSPSFSPYIFFYHTSPYAVSWTVPWDNFSWHLILVTLMLLTPNSSGTHVEGCWMSKENCCLPLEPLDMSRKKRVDWTECNFFLHHLVSQSKSYKCII